jgi:hypothetical protein
MRGTKKSGAFRNDTQHAKGFANEQKHRSGCDGRLDGNDHHHLVRVRPRRARNRDNCHEGRRSFSSSTDDVAFRPHDEARQNPSGRTMARCFLRAPGSTSERRRDWRARYQRPRPPRQAEPDRCTDFRRAACFAVGHARSHQPVRRRPIPLTGRAHSTRRHPPNGRVSVTSEGWIARHYQWLKCDSEQFRSIPRT